MLFPCYKNHSQFVYSEFLFLALNDYSMSFVFKSKLTEEALRRRPKPAFVLCSHESEGLHTKMSSCAQIMQMPPNDFPGIEDL